ncbi:hypothetical protein IQ264_27130 [Phormidium sp. LEGE 05292]|uniref:hypothetical protein n=1 Tax=[Phormidium] sp. LEGE 05292 TaxID=767427 RepID=UPI00187E3E06|nr:hypothetical protein [Phormidium sp. LEGE 05292]MBE9229083.1 hypothetical protein [Phormidium sp. LEGE 05292]
MLVRTVNAALATRSLTARLFTSSKVSQCEEIERETNLDRVIAQVCKDILEEN